MLKKGLWSYDIKINIFNSLDFLRISWVLLEAGEVVLDLLGSGHEGLNLLFGALVLIKKPLQHSSTICTKQVEHNQFVWFSGSFFCQHKLILKEFRALELGEPEIWVVLPSSSRRKVTEYSREAHLHRPCEGCWTAVPWISCWIRTSLGGLATVWMNAIFTCRPGRVTVCDKNH